MSNPPTPDNTPARISSNLSVPRKATGATFGDMLRASPVFDAHRKNVLRCLGLSESGALELLRGAHVSDAMDRVVIQNALRQRSSDNYAIQVLMSAYSQSETLASSTQKKSDDTTSNQQQKVG